MSLFQCVKCGCAENTNRVPLACQLYPDSYDWSGIEEYRGQKLCSACGPSMFSSGVPNKKTKGRWHNRFDRVFLPLGDFVTDHNGNLAHRSTGETNYRLYAVKIEPADKSLRY